MQYLRILLIPCFALLLPMSAMAGSYTVGVEDLKYAPFGVAKGNQYTGFFQELLDKFASDKGHNLTYKPMPVKRIMSELVNKGIDLKIPDNQYWAGDLKKGKGVVYSQPVTLYVDGVMVKPGKKGQGLETMATVRGFTPFPYLDDIKSGKVRLKETKSLEAVAKMALSDRVEGAFANVTVLKKYMTDEMNQAGALVFDDSLPDARSPISLSTAKYPGVIEEFDAWLAENNDWVTTLRKKYNVPGPDGM